MVKGAFRAFIPAAVAIALAIAAAASHAQVLTRPPLLHERLNPEPRFGTEQVQLLWARALLDLGLPEAYAGNSAAPGYAPCLYPTAIATLQRLRREFGPSAGYVKTWARNQDRVFSACDGRAAGAAPPLAPRGKPLPARARSDFDYQLASWHFYRQDYAAALPLFEQVGRLRAAPQRGNAAYMAVRTLAYLKRLEEAYAAIDRILADPGLREVHGIAANYRFVIMSNSNGFAPIDDGLVSPALAKRHLRWLHDTVKVDAERAGNPAQATADAKDALEQLAIYFPYHDRDGSVDWWLREGTPASARMQAVKELAPRLPLVDWMQANWAANIFETDWLWALHDADNPYWKGNANIVAHAWQRWEKERDGAWLQLAIQRIHPADPLARPVLAAAAAHLAHPWRRPQQEETAEYAVFVFTLWENAVRLHLGLGEAPQAIALLARGRETVRVLAASERMPLFARSTDPLVTLERVLRWLVYRGQVEDARATLSLAREQYPDALRRWRGLLATTVAEGHAPGEAQARFAHGAVGNDPGAWERLLDDLSSEALYQLASGSAIAQRYRAVLARTALARALILGYGDEVVDRYAALAARLNPSMREQLLAGVAQHDRGEYVSLLLRNPRLRPAVLAEYAPRTELEPNEQGKELAPEAIDVYNHNDNNWWCAFDQDRLRDRAFAAWRIVPERGRLFTGEGTDGEVAPYLDRQRALLDAHPYRSLVDAKEVEALEAIPSGPKFLSEAVIARENATTGDLSTQERNGRAADLHRAVRTTRYGCNRDGSHAAYSRAAFKLLHERYGDTPWAKATPYWFK